MPFSSDLFGPHLSLQAADCSYHVSCTRRKIERRKNPSCQNLKPSGPVHASFSWECTQVLINFSNVGHAGDMTGTHFATLAWYSWREPRKIKWAESSHPTPLCLASAATSSSSPGRASLFFDFCQSCFSVEWFDRGEDQWPTVYFRLNI